MFLAFRVVIGKVGRVSTKRVPGRLKLRSFSNSALNIFTYVALMILPVPALAEDVTTKPAIVSFTFDDGGMTQFDNGLRIAAAYGISGTIFLPTELVNASTAAPGESWVIDWSKARAFLDAGWEIGAHGRSHLKLTELEEAEIETEIEGPILDIEREIGVRPVSFSSPFGAFTDQTIARIMESYTFHLSWKGHGGRNPTSGIDPRYIGRLEVTFDMSATLVCGEMVRAAQNDTWLVLLFHGIVNGDPADYQITANKFEAIIACARFLEDNGIVEVKTVRDAMAAIEAGN